MSIVIDMHSYKFIQIDEMYGSVTITYNDCDINMSCEQFEELYLEMKKWHEGIKECI